MAVTEMDYSGSGSGGGSYNYYEKDLQYGAAHFYNVENAAFVVHTTANTVNMGGMVVEGVYKYTQSNTSIYSVSYNSSTKELTVTWIDTSYPVTGFAIYTDGTDTP